MGVSLIPIHQDLDNRRAIPVNEALPENLYVPQ